MNTKEVLRMVDDEDFINEIYQFAYRRCNTSYEAEDLCSEIIIAVIVAIHKQVNIDNFYAFVWTIARRVYADYCEKRSKNSVNISIENVELTMGSQNNEIDEFLEETMEREQIKKIFREIAFLSKAYREVMVMYYIDEYKIKDIATDLNISETTVKQRLFWARNSIRKEVETMNDRELSIKPVQLEFIGCGNPCGNDPRTKAERMLSHNLIYMCKNKARTAKELSDELCIPMTYIEEELEIQCQGENGNYGTLRKLDNGKYITNMLLVDYDEYETANKIYEQHLPEFCRILKSAVDKNRDKILSFPYLSPQNDIKFILWSLISKTIWDFEHKVNNVIKNKYFSDVVPVNRDFTTVGIALPNGQKAEYDFYGCDGIDATSVGGYKAVFVSNIYGKRIEQHFSCGHNIAKDDLLLMVIRAIGGLDVNELTDDEKEIAAKAIECGYLRKNNNLLEPKIIVFDGDKNDDDFYNMSYDLTVEMDELVEEIAEDLSRFMKKNIPIHLMNEYQFYTTLIAGTKFLSQTIEECIKEGMLSEPERPLGAEGVIMVVTHECERIRQV